MDNNNKAGHRYTRDRFAINFISEALKNTLESRFSHSLLACIILAIIPFVKFRDLVV